MGSVFNHVGHCVSDVERSTRFYVDVLGFELWREFDAPDPMTAQLLALSEPVGLKAVYLRQGEFILELPGLRRCGVSPVRRPPG